MGALCVSRWPGLFAGPRVGEASMAKRYSVCQEDGFVTNNVCLTGLRRFSC